MDVSIICAMDLGRVIGVENRLPWRLPKEFRRFKALTAGHCVVMGRRTWESHEMTGPLPGRDNVVVTRTPGYAAPGATVVGSVEAALAVARAPVDILGGTAIFRAALPSVTKLRLSVVLGRFAGDTWFPDPGPTWRIVAEERFGADEKNSHAFVAVDLDRDAAGTFVLDDYLAGLSRT